MWRDSNYLRAVFCMKANSWKSTKSTFPEITIARIIEKITIEKGYKIHISFYLTREEIMKEFHSGEVEISEADTWYLTGT